MKQFLPPLLGIAFSLTVFVGSVSTVSAFLPEPERDGFRSNDVSTLWTLQPVKVDRSKQHFERLPALNVPEQAIAEARKASRRENITGSTGAANQIGTGAGMSFQPLKSSRNYDGELASAAR